MVLEQTIQSARKLPCLQVILMFKSDVIFFSIWDFNKHLPLECFLIASLWQQATKQHKPSVLITPRKTLHAPLTNAPIRIIYITSSNRADCQTKKKKKTFIECDTHQSERPFNQVYCLNHNPLPVFNNITTMGHWMQVKINCTQFLTAANKYTGGYYHLCACPTNPSSIFMVLHSCIYERGAFAVRANQQQ